jgi:hypothetical protein
LAGGITIILGRETTASSASFCPASTRAKTAAIASGAATFRLRGGFIDAQSAAGDFFPVKSGHSLGSVLILRHFNEGESARLAGFAIGYDVDARDLPERLKQRAQITFRGLKAHIPDKQILHNDSPEACLHSFRRK